MEKGQLGLALQYFGWIAVLTGLQFSPMLQWFLARILRKFQAFWQSQHIGSFFAKMLGKIDKMHLGKLKSELTGICRIFMRESFEICLIHAYMLRQCRLFDG